jgi:mono/diheme cytochrome c family protein
MTFRDRPAAACGLLAFALAILLVPRPGVSVADGTAILTGSCAGCHALTGPAPRTLQELWTRKGPDLFYAGNKYRVEWLETWLQRPTRIRPAGMYYGNHVTRGANGDEVDASSLPQHPALSAEEARAVAGALMTLTGKGDLIRPGEYQKGTISLSMGEMLFDKFRGCVACHEIEPGYGGLSGPEVYTAAKRLQEDYLISFMRHPQAWDPKTFMPNKRLTEPDLQKLVHYLTALSAEAGK